MSHSESIQKQFLDSIQEVYATLMTNQIFLKLLDEENTDTNVYDETGDKKYLTPIQLVGKFVLSSNEGEEVVEGVQEFVVATIPTKELITKSVPHTPQDYDTLRKGVISYKSEDYTVVDIKPRVNIDDCFMFYDFVCEKPKIRR